MKNTYGPTNWFPQIKNQYRNWSVNDKALDPCMQNENPFIHSEDTWKIGEEKKKISHRSILITVSENPSVRNSRTSIL